MSLDQDKNRHYSLRKLSVGLASVLIGISFVSAKGQVVKADNVKDNAKSAINEQAVKPETQDMQASILKGTSEPVKQNAKNVNMTGIKEKTPPVQNSVKQANRSENSNSSLKSNDVSSLSKNTQTAQNDVPRENRAEVTSDQTATTQPTNTQDQTVITQPQKKQQTSFDQNSVTDQSQKNLMDNLGKQKTYAQVGDQVEDNVQTQLQNSQKLNLTKHRQLAKKVLATNLIETNSSPMTNGGFDEATWGKLDVNAWKGSVQGDYYQLNDYTGDGNHVIVPNEADFEKAGISTSGKQVGVTSSLMHTIFKHNSANTNVTIAFSKTDNKMVKAIDSNWSGTWNPYENFWMSASLSKFDGTNLDVSNVTNMSQMFYGSRSSDLSSLANWKVDNVTDMSEMFYNNQISDLSPLANWKVDNVTDMSEMFYSNKISDLSPLANWKVDNVTDMGNMFGQNQISDLSPLANWKVDNVTNMGNMFGQNQISDISSLANWKVDNVTNMGNMFEQNQISDLSPLTNWKVDNVKDMSSMFEQNQISDLSSLANWKVDNVTDMSKMFGQNQISDLSPLANWKVDNVTNMGSMFEQNQISNLSPLASWHTDNVTNMSNMFCSNKISNLSPLANWKVDNVGDMGFMFAVNQISDLDPLANWKVDNVGGMFCMFAGNQISDLGPLANWKVDNVGVMGSMFEQNQISDLSPLAGWKTGNVTDMSNMFYGNHISDVSPLANWNVNSVNYMDRMFDNNLSVITQAKRVINFVYPAGYTGKKQDSVTQTVDLPQKVKIELTTKDSKPSNNILDWVTKTETPEASDPVYFQDYTVPEIKGLLEPDKTVISKQQADIAKPINVTVTYKLVDSNTNDAYALDSKNGLHEHANVNDNGGYDEDYWGTIDLNNWNYSQDDTGNITLTGYKGSDNTKIIVPNIADFACGNAIKTITLQVNPNVDTNKVYISSSVMHDLAHNATRIGLSKTANKKVAASDAIWQDAFGGVTNGPSGDNGDGGIKVLNPNLTVMDLHNLDTSNITEMSAMFNGGTNLKTIGDLSDWDTGKITNMHAMFQSASNLTNIGNLNNWNTSSVTDMSYMFNRASNLTNIGDLSKWDTGKVTDMSAMFQSASNLTNIGNLDNWNTSNVTDMSAMFQSASSLTNIGDLSKWNTSNVTDISCMFNGTSNLTNIGDLSKWDTSKVIDMSFMFNQASNLTNIGDLDNWNTGKVIDMSAMFQLASNLTNIGDLSNWDTSNVTDMSFMFNKASNLTNIGNLSKWYTGNVTDMSHMFNRTSNLTNIGDLSNWDTSKVTNMNTMFQLTSSLTNIGNLDNWNTSNVTDMSYMFNQASNLTNIGNLSKWDTSKVTDMQAMFQLASSLTNIGNLNNWNTSNVTDMNRMFNQASNLTNIGDLSKWNTSKVTDMQAMFQAASSLTNIGDLSKWDTSKITNMSCMFINANSLRNLNISNWNLAKLTDKEALKYIFANDVNLTVIANNITLPTWYDNELNDSDYFWNNHMAVITNNDKLLKATGDTDTLTIDNTHSARSIFYDSKGSSDAIKVLTDANDQYIADYNKANPTKVLKLANTVDQSDPISLANASFITVPNTVKTIITYHDSTDNMDLTHTQELSGINQIIIEPSNLILPENYELDGNLPAMQYGTNYLINVKHKMAVVIQQDLATRTINVHLPNGTTKVYQQVIGYQRNVITDLVTKEVTHGTWTVNDVTSSFTIDGVKQLEHSYVLQNGTYNYASVKLPKIPGYKAKILRIPSDNPAQPAMFLISFVALPSVNPGVQNTPDDTKQDQDAVINTKQDQDAVINTKQDQDAVINTKHLNTSKMQIVSNQPVLLENADNSLQMLNADDNSQTLNADDNSQTLNADTSTWQVENNVADELITPYVVFNSNYKLHLPRFNNYNLQIIKRTSNKDNLSFVYLDQNKTFKYVFNIKIEDGKYLLSISQIENKRFIPVKQISFNDYHQLIELIVKLIK